MNIRLLEQLPVREIERGLEDWLAKERACTAQVLAHLGELETRLRFQDDGFDTMEEFCLHGLHRDEDEIPKELAVARLSRRFPALLPAIADGRLSLETAVLIGPHLTPEKLDEWIATAANKSDNEILAMLAEKAER